MQQERYSTGTQLVFKMPNKIENKNKNKNPSAPECGNCTGSVAGLMCGRCAHTFYCSKACQKEHWKAGHNKSCVPLESRHPCFQHHVHEDGEECSVCLAGVTPATACKLPCSHTFHVDCVAELRKHAKGSAACPLCRQKLPKPADVLLKETCALFFTILSENTKEKCSLESFTPAERAKFEEMIAALQTAGNLGLGEASFLLAQLYHLGEVVEQNVNEALVWYEKAADQGNVSAMSKLGYLYQDGVGVVADLKKAFSYYTRAASRGNASAQVNLGTMYAEGSGVEVDNVKAVYFFEKAALEGHVIGQFNLAIMHDNGRGVPQNDVKAMVWYKKAALQGNGPAMFNLGLMYKYGRGTKTNEKEAIKWFIKSAAHGCENAKKVELP